MEGPRNNKKRNSISIWKLQEVCRALGTSWLRSHTQAFTMVGILVPFFRKQHRCQERIVCDVYEGEDWLGDVGFKGVSDDTAGVVR